MTLATDPSVPPTLLSGSEIYDLIMSAIEPELCICELPTIAKRSASETAEQRSERAKRYERAFKTYDDRFNAYCKEWHQSFVRYRRFSLRSLEGSLGTSSPLDAITSSIQSA